MTVRSQHSEEWECDVCGLTEESSGMTPPGAWIRMQDELGVTDLCGGCKVAIKRLIRFTLDELDVKALA